MATTNTGTTSSGGNESTPAWNRAIFALCGLLSTFAVVWGTMNDTPVRRAEIEKGMLINDGKKSDVELARIDLQKTKILARSAGTLQPLVAPKPQQQARATIVVGSDGQHFLAAGINFVIEGDGGNTPSAIVAFRQPPASTTGQFKIFALGKTAWTDDWDGTPSPYPLKQLLLETISTDDNVRYFPVFSRGKTFFNM